MDKIIDDLQKTPTYTVTQVGGDSGDKKTVVDNYRAINSKTDEAKVVEEIASADTVTCAVGPNILKFIAPVIAKGLNARTKSTPAAVIACENMVNATDKLKEFIVEKLDEKTKANISNVARFANSAVDRIVPHQDDGAGLNVKIEAFWEWCVELPPFKGTEEPKVKAIHYVDDLSPYIERKLFTVNTGHATTAYFAKQAGKEWIHEALKDETIRSHVDGVLKETAHLIVNKHGIPASEQNEYVEKIIKRFSNDALLDKVDRVGRQPLRKLSRNERLIAPAAQLAESGDKHDKLLDVIEAALRFQNVEGDDESVELAKILKENSAEEATKKITGLEESHVLFKEVVARVKKVQG